MRFPLIVIIAFLVSSCTPPIDDAMTVPTQNGPIEITRIADGLEHPWALAFLPDGRMLITERPGRLRIIDEGRVSAPLEGLPLILASGQGGLLDIALHPRFEENRLVYFTSSAAASGGSTTQIARARLENDALSDVEVLFTAVPSSRSSVHYGSRIALSDEYVFISIGDRGSMDDAQNLSSHAGSIIRLHHDGRIPVDNPFISEPDALDEIYAYGVRNPQGLIWRSDRGELWAHEHGPRGGDEVNLIVSGGNYGWPLYTTGERYVGGRIGLDERPEDTIAPLHEWTPSIAPSGFVHYTSTVMDAWTDDLFIGALAGQRLVRLSLDEGTLTGEEQLLVNTIGRIRDVREGPDGLIYLLTDDRNGAIYRLGPFV